MRAQHPHQAGGRAAVGVVVGDDAGVLGDAETAQGRGEVRGVGQRVPARLGAPEVLQARRARPRFASRSCSSRAAASASVMVLRLSARARSLSLYFACSHAALVHSAAVVLPPFSSALALGGGASLPPTPPSRW